jgi:hypothetical protein
MKLSEKWTEIDAGINIVHAVLVAIVVSWVIWKLIEMGAF